MTDKFAVIECTQVRRCWKVLEGAGIYIRHPHPFASCMFACMCVFVHECLCVLGYNMAVGLMSGVQVVADSPSSSMGHQLSGWSNTPTAPAHYGGNVNYRPPIAEAIYFDACRHRLLSVAKTELRQRMYVMTGKRGNGKKKVLTRMQMYQHASQPF